MSVCPACGATFACGMVDAPLAESCWCVQLPRLTVGELVSAKDGAGAKCFCPACLRLRKAAIETRRNEAS